MKPSRIQSTLFIALFTTFLACSLIPVLLVHYLDYSFALLAICLGLVLLLTQLVSGPILRLLDNRAELLTRAHQELQEQRSSALASAKWASLGEMSAGIAHEINTPLAVIAIAAHDLRRRIEKGEAAAQLNTKLDTIEKTVHRIAGIIEGLRLFAREGAHDPFLKTPAQEILKGTLDLCRQRFLNHAIDLKTPPLEGLGSELECQSIQISQVLLNLLNNAFDAVDALEGGQNKWVQVECKDLGTSVEFAITDNGSGISPEVRDRIFDPFVTTKKMGKGTGLGLSISKRIVESHHGSLTVDPASPKTRFIISLPKEQKTAAPF